MEAGCCGGGGCSVKSGAYPAILLSAFAIALVVGLLTVLLLQTRWPSYHKHKHSLVIFMQHLFLEVKQFNKD